MWLVYAKKHSGLPSLTYNDAVEEALCFGWIDSKVHPIDDAFYMQVFTPRKPKSAWSALNKARIEHLLAAGLMSPAGLAVVKSAKDSGTWYTWKQVEELTIPPDLQKAIAANRAASRNWASYSESRRRAVLYRLAGAKRPDASEIPSGHHQEHGPQFVPGGTHGEGRLPTDVEVLTTGEALTHRASFERSRSGVAYRTAGRRLRPGFRSAKSGMYVLRPLAGVFLE